MISLVPSAILKKKILILLYFIAKRCVMEARKRKGEFDILPIVEK